MLIDSNIIIYALQAKYIQLRNWIIDNEPQYSIISRVEVLGFTKLNEPIAKVCNFLVPLLMASWCCLKYYILFIIK